MFKSLLERTRLALKGMGRILGKGASRLFKLTEDETAAASFSFLFIGLFVVYKSIILGYKLKVRLETSDPEKIAAERVDPKDISTSKLLLVGIPGLMKMSSLEIRMLTTHPWTVPIAVLYTAAVAGAAQAVRERTLADKEVSLVDEILAAAIDGEIPDLPPDKRPVAVKFEVVKEPLVQPEADKTRTEPRCVFPEGPEAEGCSEVLELAREPPVKVIVIN